MNSPPIPKRCRRRWPWVILAVCALPVAAAFVWYLSVRISNHSAVKRLEAKIRARGEPVTLEELAASFPPVPDDQNAAVALLDAWEKTYPAFWKAFRDGTSPMPEKKIVP